MKPAFIAAALLLALPLSAQTTVTDFGPNQRIVDLLSAPLSEKQQEGYAEFAKDVGYFGAFSVSQSGTDWYYVHGYHSIAAAKDFAQRGCERTQGSAPSPCFVHAISLPEGVDERDHTLSGMSQIAADEFQTEYLDNHREGVFSAFAISGAGAYGLTYGWDTEADARASALAFCTSSAIGHLADVTIATREWAQAKGFDTCRVIDVQMP